MIAWRTTFPAWRGTWLSLMIAEGRQIQALLGEALTLVGEMK